MLIFAVVSALPGDYVDMLMGKSGMEGFDREMVESNLGLDAPKIVQYARWMGFAPQKDGSFSGILQGNFGKSWWQGTSVLKLMATKWPITFELGILGLLIAQVIALPIGIYSAIRQDLVGDYLGRSLAILFISVPGFWLGTLIIVLPAIWWKAMPSLVLIRLGDDPIGNLKMFILPAIVLGMSMCGVIMRLSRTMMLEVLRQDYIRTAWAKGLKENAIVKRHALKNAFIPVVTMIGINARVLIGGTVIIEQIFMLPGMGRLIIEATNQRDAPLMMGAMMFFAVALSLLNLFVDVMYAFLDPRTDLGS